jgi:REase_DpnII-MboI
MNMLEWAKWGADYLQKVRLSRQDEFNGAVEENRGWDHSVERGDWREIPKSIVGVFYHASLELVGDTEIPGSLFSTPLEFEGKIRDFVPLITAMRRDLDVAIADADRRFNPPHTPDHIEIIQRLIDVMISSIDYVFSQRPQAAVAKPSGADTWALLVHLARRFHESVLSLKKHLHGGTPLVIADEWDCQYLFRAILAAYFNDVRPEEWNPSVAGSHARCEFFLKAHRTMIELKYVRKESDQAKIKGELAKDLLDYGANPEVDHLCVLVYDPEQKLPHPVQLEHDLSKPTQDLRLVQVIVSPPRGTSEPMPVVSAGAALS